MNQHYSPEEKVKILEEGEKAGVSVAEVCRRYQIPTTTYFTWRKEAREAMGCLQIRKNSNGIV